MDTKKITAERLFQLRKKANLSQKEIAEMLGINRATYSYYEAGKTEPGINSLIFLADYYHTSIDYIVGRKER